MKASTWKLYDVIKFFYIHTKDTEKAIDCVGLFSVMVAGGKISCETSGSLDSETFFSVMLVCGASCSDAPGSLDSNNLRSVIVCGGRSSCETAGVSDSTGRWSVGKSSWLTTKFKLYGFGNKGLGDWDKCTLPKERSNGFFGDSFFAD